MLPRFFWMVLVLLLIVPAGTVQAQEETVVGRIQRVVRERNEVHVVDRGKEDWVFRIDAATVITLLGRKAGLADLRAGYDVEVTYEEKAPARPAVQTRSRLATRIRAEGIVGRPRTPPSGGTLVVEDRDRKEWKVQTGAATQVTLDGQPSELAALRPSFRLKVVYEQQGENLVAARIEAERPKETGNGSTKKKASGGVKKDDPIAKDGPVEWETDQYWVVKVFYGTDRKPLGTPSPSGGTFWVYFPALLSGVGTLILAGLGWWRLPILRRVARYGLAVTVAAVVCGVYVRFGLPAPPPRPLEYGSESGDLHYGSCEVSVPKIHRVGELERPSLLWLEIHEDPARHVVMRSVTIRPEDAFFGELKERVGRSSKKDAFVFVHGFNVSFEEAALRTAQLAFDLGFQGAPIFYSWPSRKPPFYTADEDTVRLTRYHLNTFLKQVAARSGAEAVHLLAHSMGNRPLTQAMQDMAAEPSGIPTVFQQVVLTAPDVNAEEFRRHIFPAIQGKPRRVTLYASSRDWALWASKQVHDYGRAGESGPGLVVLEGLDTIDVSDIDTSFLGHSAYGECRAVLTDLGYLLREGLPPDRRAGLRRRDLDGLPYWFCPP